MALDQEGIEHTVTDTGLSDLIIGYRSTEAIGETAPPFEILVRQEDASRALDVLRDIERSGAATAGAEAAAAASPATATSAGSAPAARAVAPPAGTTNERVMLFDVATGAPIGRITDAQLEQLAEHLEEESSEDDDYYIDAATLTMLEEQRVDASLVALLRSALGSRDGMDIRWSRR
jgi:processive 1,2-diacylglycerol beta-glucosyltransferase